jgi:DNA-binding MarR family transcriptional regulator
MKGPAKPSMENETSAERLRKSLALIQRFLKLPSAVEAQIPIENMNLSDVTIVTLVAERPGCIMRDVAATLESPLSTATTVVDRLVRRGLIVRERDDRNRRVVRLRLTAEGDHLRQMFIEFQRRSSQAMLDALTPEERPLFLNFVEKIAAAAGEKSLGTKLSYGKCLISVR